MQPKVLLMDEPFGALDALTRAHLQDSLMEIQNELNNTVIMITHDVDEAVLLSDRIVMMTNGPAATVGQILDINLPRPPRPSGAGMIPPITTTAPKCCVFSMSAKPDVPHTSAMPQQPDTLPVAEHKAAKPLLKLATTDKTDAKVVNG